MTIKISRKHREYLPTKTGRYPNKNTAKEIKTPLSSTAPAKISCFEIFSLYSNLEYNWIA
jgi:hypothetical protein